MSLVKLTCIAIFCLLALGAGAVQAQEWEIKGEALAELEIESETVNVKGGAVSLLSSGWGLTVECKASESKEASIGTGGTLKGTLQLTGCKSLLKNCVVNETITAKVIAELAERNGAIYLVFAAQSGPLTTITFKSGMGCALPEKLELLGNLAAEVTTTESIELAISFSEAAASAAETKATLGATKTAFLVGKASESMSGSHEGETMAPWTGTLNPNSGLDFTGKAVGTRLVVNAENIGWSLSFVTMEKQWILEGGVKNENNFTIVPIVNPAPLCNYPFQNEEPFETLHGKGTNCNLGIEFKSGAAGKNAIYVLEYGPSIFYNSQYKFPIKS